MKNIEFELLFNNQELIEDFVKLIYKNWRHLRPDQSYEELLLRIKKKVSSNKVPIHIIAKNNNEFVAGLIIKENEMT